jgi:hypothetical protein
MLETIAEIARRFEKRQTPNAQRPTSNESDR